MMARFSVYEIEHDGDVDDSTQDLRDAGCTNVRVIDTDFDEEYMVVECDLPRGVTLEELPSRLTVACL